MLRNYLDIQTHRYRRYIHAHDSFIDRDTMHGLTVIEGSNMNKTNSNFNLNIITNRTLYRKMHDKMPSCKRETLQCHGLEMLLRNHFHTFSAL
jgi:hypothetical protein